MPEYFHMVSWQPELTGCRILYWGGGSPTLDDQRSKRKKMSWLKIYTSWQNPLSCTCLQYVWLLDQCYPLLKSKSTKSAWLFTGKISPSCCTALFMGNIYNLISLVSLSHPPPFFPSALPGCLNVHIWVTFCVKHGMFLKCSPSKFSTLFLPWF